MSTFLSLEHSLFLLHHSSTSMNRSPTAPKKKKKKQPPDIDVKYFARNQFKILVWAIMFLSFCICKIFIETAFFVVAIQLQLYNHHNKCCCLQDNSAILASGGATLGPKGALAPPKYLKKLVYIYSRVILIKKCYIHNIFKINLK